jgi:hypothetical protein
MSHQSLSNRLRQQSRGAGLATAMVMALTLALCIGGGIVIYSQLDPLTRDFVSANVTVTPAQVAQATREGASGATRATNTPVPDEDDPTPTPEPEDTFRETHTTNLTDVPVNYRSGPGTDQEALTQLAPGTPLQATGEFDTDSAGTVWLEFVTEDGLRGWIREIDAIPAN